ncbi:MAG: tRNA pseudouridine(38-40) synthase TruA [Bacteroidetes bacterium]|nr:tRNA pseudouridine(38-40) synthase TruA [Bacteroidota bacterium]
MYRYFINVAYRGDNYSGFQKQLNANTIQDEIERALKIYFKSEIELTGSSRTDAGVHAINNFFQMDITNELSNPSKDVYHLNAILPNDIVIKKIHKVDNDAHCRFDATSRKYHYKIYDFKNPFLNDVAYYFPYSLNFESLNKAAEVIFHTSSFQTFSKKHTQARTFNCKIFKSRWLKFNEVLIYEVEANRFLRGMVKGLVGTMLKVGRGLISIEEFESIVLSKDCSKADFSVPSHGLTLMEVNY